MSAQQRYWHGGRPGARAGDVIRTDPPEVDAFAIGVEVHTDRDGARMRAATIKGGGSLYRVEPLGPLTEFGEGRYALASSVRVLSVYDAVVRPSAKQMRRWARQMQADQG